MIAHILMAAVLSQSVPGPETRTPVSWYRVFAMTYEGRCGYTVTDVANITARQFREQISDGYDRRAGFIVLTASDTMPQCVRKARSVVRSLRFAAVIVRAAKPSDYGGGVP